MYYTALQKLCPIFLYFSLYKWDRTFGGQYIDRLTPTGRLILLSGNENMNGHAGGFIPFSTLLHNTLNIFIKMNLGRLVCQTSANIKLLQHLTLIVYMYYWSTIHINIEYSK